MAYWSDFAFVLSAKFGVNKVMGYCAKRILVISLWWSEITVMSNMRCGYAWLRTEITVCSITSSCMYDGMRTTMRFCFLVRGELGLR